MCVSWCSVSGCLHGNMYLVTCTVLLLLVSSPVVTGQYRGVGGGLGGGGRGYEQNHGFTHNSLTPMFKDTERNITTGPGGRAILRCKVENLGTKTVVWRKSTDSHPLTIGLFTFVGDTRISVDYNQRTNEWSLIIQDVKPEDEGVYHCQISTKAHQRKVYDIKLNVNTVQVSGTQFVNRNEEVKLVCNATGKPDPPHDVEWFKDGHAIISDARNGILITKKIQTTALISVLAIEHSTDEDRGDYVCRSSNRDYGKLTVQILSGSGSTSNANGKRSSGATMQHIHDNGASFCSVTSLFYVMLTSLAVTMVTVTYTTSRTHTWLPHIR